jgi:hypothetical protein
MSVLGRLADSNQAPRQAPISGDPLQHFDGLPLGFDFISGKV